MTNKDKETLLNLKEYMSKTINRFPYLQEGIEKIYNKCLDNIKKGIKVQQASQECMEQIEVYIYL